MLGCLQPRHRQALPYNQSVETKVATQLLALNHQFYQRLAEPFSASRARLQPGVQRALRNLPVDATVLDLGCGNGGVAVELAQRGHRGDYVGVDSSEGLLEKAKLNVQTSKVQRSGGLEVKFVQAELTDNFSQQSAIRNRQFDLVFAFAVLHHIPSEQLRLEFLRRVGSVLAPHGRFIFSTWQFLNSPRLSARIQPWSALGLTEAEVDKDDYLLDWRSGELGLRYVHLFSEGELQGLAEQTGFTLTETYYSDGENGKLGLYEIWHKKTQR